ncbi:MAG: hypothetical protein EKK53_03605 [Burkholderiales bacterium]|nr:MAG: hypothetical protein EKK53_03605 [Burkholderiales bacterium]
MAASLAIHRYRARLPAQVEPVAARLALQLLAADLDDALPRSLPPQALLWLRRLSIEVPPVALRRVRTGHDAVVAQGREQFDAALARAARPALGPVPPDAEAVLFADEAEMLACLALAAQAGQLDRWWWRGLLGTRWPAWTPAWAQRPWAQAGARRLLAQAGRASAAPGAAAPRAEPMAVGPLPAAVVPPISGAPRAAGAVFEAGGAALAWPGDVDGRGVTERPASGDRARRHGTPTSVAGAPQRLTRSSQGLPPVDAQAPRVPGLGHRRADAPAASAPEAANVSGAAPRVPREFASSRRDAATPAMDAPRKPRSAEPGRAAGPSVQTAPSTGLPSTPHEAEQRDTPWRAGPAPAPEPADPPRLRLAEAPTTAPAVHPWPRHPAASSADAPPTEASEAAPPVWPWPEAQVSHQGALLFLVNVLLEDGLYPDFTRPLDPGLPVPIAALLAALAQAWRLPPDPLQVLLVAQAGGWQPAPAMGAMPAAPGVAPGSWSRWLPAYARRLRQRLCRRLGLAPRQWRAALHRERPCRVWVSVAAWEVVFDLADHDVAWRLAGLDRDPGWLPSADLNLRFSFR